MTELGPVPVREGELVAGKYRVGGVIGVGGMGVVVEALHEQLDKRIAIKFVRGEVLGNDEAVARFLREARAAAKLKSEHAAKVLDVGLLESGVPYMVMELLEGADLAQTLAERGPLPIEIAAEWIAQACEAVAEAHAAGIVHRDLKPQNLFLARTVGGAVNVKVLDFGVAKSVQTAAVGPGALTHTRAMLGSPLYMAPEQMRSARGVDCRADVWALGVVLFELLTQRMPFEAETLPDLCLKVVGDAPLSLCELRADIPNAMAKVVEHCLEKDAERRYANAAELASALEPFVPPGSRIVVERARMAMTRAAETPLYGSGVLEREATPVLQTPPAHTSAPTAWGPAKKPRRTSRARGVALWAAAGVALAILGLGAAVGLRRPRAGVSRAWTAPSSAPAAPSSEALAPEILAPPSVAIATLAVPASPPSASARLEPAAAPLLRAPVLPLASRPGFAAPPAKVPAQAPPQRVPPSSDDDIPSLR
jgi:eukaryotic-like serine/threonine-protein kinase